jgi:hypothetical protein
VRPGRRSKRSSQAGAFQPRHVDELRQLVEAGAAQDAADTGDPAVAHRAELEDGEGAAGTAEALLAEEHRTSVFEQDGDRDGGHHRQEEEQAAGGADNVEGPFQGHGPKDYGKQLVSVK